MEMNEDKMYIAKQRIPVKYKIYFSFYLTYSIPGTSNEMVPLCLPLDACRYPMRRLNSLPPVLLFSLARTYLTTLSAR